MQVYQATKKGSTDEVSILVFDKDKLSSIPSADRERVLEVLRKDIKSATTLRHPSIVKVVELLEENRKALAIVTEPIQCSLANIIGDTMGFKHDEIPSDLKETTLSSFEITCGLMRIAEGIDFLHTAAKKTHGDLSPRSIYITPGGTWKLGGFGFSSGFSAGTL
jgi:SCY1-like protein 2